MKNKQIGPYQIGSTYFIRTVTHHFTGVLIKVFKQELVLKDAAWIADDGRFTPAVRDGSFNEVEPYPDGEVIIGRGSLIDAYAVKFNSPRTQK